MVRAAIGVQKGGRVGACGAAYHEAIPVTTPARVVAARGPALVGRERETVVLEAELARAGAGEFRTVLVVADPGVGKTRLVGEFMARHGAEVLGLAARAHPLGETTSFGLWAEALEGHLRGLERGEVAGLCGGFVDDLGALLRSAVAAQGSPPSGEPPRTRLLEGLAVLVANLVRGRPVVLFLDDVHVADASSWDALHYLARNLPRIPMLVVATARPGELAGQLEATQVLLGLEQDGLLTRLELRLLSPEALGALTEAVIGVPAPLALIAWLDERSRGNPLFALGLLAALLEEGADLAAPRLRRLPEGLAERVTTRLANLEDAARATLEVLAVLGRRVELSNVVALTARPLDVVGPLLDGLVRSRLVTEEERGREVIYEIVHPLIQEAIYESLGAARRHALHRFIGRTLLAAGRLGEAAPHFARSAEAGDSEAIDALSGAVRQAEARGAYREALTVLGTLVELIPPGDERWLDVLDAMALDAEWVIDHRADVHAALAVPALRAIDAMLEGTADPGRRATVKLRLSSFLTWGTGDLEGGRQAAQEAQELFDAAGNASGRLLARLEEAFNQGFAGDMAGWLSGAAHVAEAAAVAGERLPLRHALGRGLGWGGFWIGSFDEAKGALRRAIAMAEEDGKAYSHSVNLSGLALTLALEGRIGETYSMLVEAKRVNPDWRESLLLEYEILVHWLAGDFESALSQGRESVGWNASGMSRRRAVGMTFAVLAGVETGRFAEAGRFAAVARAAYENRPWVAWTDVCACTEAVLGWRQARQSDALSVIERATDRIRGMTMWPWAAFPLFDLAEMAAEISETGTAVRAADGLADVASRLDRDLYRSMAAMARGWAALAARHGDEAVEAAERAVDLLPQDYRCLYGRALDLLGRCLGPTDRGRARQALEEAAAAFESCGAGWRRDQALDAVRRLGGGPRPRAATALGPAALTRRERDVAGLAARGRTAPQIARELFIGERTVESHLARIYAKLGVESKLDLVRRAAELGLADP
jgi:DNA-binding CsgD family transcriptional regulator